MQTALLDFASSVPNHRRHLLSRSSCICLTEVTERFKVRAMTRWPLCRRILKHLLYRSLFPHQPPLPHWRTAGHQLHASLWWNSKPFKCRTDAHYWGSDLKGWCYMSAHLVAVCWYTEMLISFDFHHRLLFCCVTDTRCLMEIYCVTSRVVTFGTNVHYIYNSDEGRYFVLDHHYSLSLFCMFCFCVWNVARCLRQCELGFVFW